MGIGMFQVLYSLMSGPSIQSNYSNPIYKVKNHCPHLTDKDTEAQKSPQASYQQGIELAFEFPSPWLSSQYPAQPTLCLEELTQEYVFLHNPDTFFL